MKFTTSLSLFFVFVFSCQAWSSSSSSFGSPDMTAQTFSSWISRAETADRLAEELPLAAPDKEKFQLDLKEKFSRDNMKMKVIAQNQTQIHLFVADESAKVSFRRIDQGELYVNDQMVRLSSQKTYLNYRAEIEAILGRKGQYGSFSLLNVAHAQEKKQRKIAAVSAVLASSNEYVLSGRGPQTAIHTAYAKGSDLSGLDQVLLQGLRNEANKSMRISGPKFFSGLDFTCEKGELQKVSERIFIADHKPSKKELRLFVRKSATKFHYSDTLCRTDVSSEGKIANPVGQAPHRCFFDRESFFDQQPFFKFPIAAAECCRQKGCYEKVRAGTQKLVDSYLKKGAGGSPSKSKSTK